MYEHMIRVPLIIRLPASSDDSMAPATVDFPTVNGEELYDLAQDPEELENLASDPGYQDIKQELESRLNGWMRDNDDPFDFQNPTTRDGQALAKRCPGAR